MSGVVYSSKMKDDDIWDDTALIKMYEDSIKATVNKSRSASTTSAGGKTTWKVGDRCMAPYYPDELWYPCEIVSIDNEKKQAEVYYDGYDAQEWVELSDLTEEVETEQYEEPQEEHVQESKPGTSSQSPKKKNANSSFKSPKKELLDSSPKKVLPRFAPPPPPSVLAGLVPPDEVEALSSMLMSWYMSGYHTGYYQCLSDMKKKSGNE